MNLFKKFEFPEEFAKLDCSAVIRSNPKSLLTNFKPKKQEYRERSTTFHENNFKSSK